VSDEIVGGDAGLSGCFHLAWPLVISSQLAVWSEAIVMFWLGHLGGTDSIAIYTVTLPVYYFAACAFTGIAIGASPQIAWSVGAKDGRGLSLTVSALWLAALASVAAIVIALPAAGPLASVLSPRVDGSPDVALESGTASMLMAMFVVMLPLTTMAEILVVAANSAGWTSVAMGRSLLDLVMLGALAPLLMAPLHAGGAGAPLACGVSGGALAVLVWRMLRRRGRSEFGTAVGRADVPKVATWRRIVDIGLPVQASRIAYFAAQTLLIHRAAERERGDVAGYGLAWMVVSFGFAMTFAFSQGGAIIAGQSLGTGDLTRARKAVRSAMTLALVIGGGLVFALLTLAPGPLLRCFNDDPHTVAAGLDALAILRWALFPAAVFEALLAGFTAFGATKRAGLLGGLSDVVAVIYAYTWDGAASPTKTVAMAACISAFVRAVLYVVLARFVFRQLPPARPREPNAA
jgi:Na+-driven multidrug efflux pump